jgi:hypothetical protein
VFVWTDFEQDAAWSVPDNTFSRYRGWASPRWHSYIQVLEYWCKKIEPLAKHLRSVRFDLGWNGTSSQEIQGLYSPRFPRGLFLIEYLSRACSRINSSPWHTAGDGTSLCGEVIFPACCHEVFRKLLVVLHMLMGDNLHLKILSLSWLFSYIFWGAPRITR